MEFLRSWEYGIHVCLIKQIKSKLYSIKEHTQYPDKNVTLLFMTLLRYLQYMHPYWSIDEFGYEYVNMVVTSCFLCF